MAQISVATINLGNRGDRWRQRRHLLVAQLLDQLPNLISLQEVSLSIGQGQWLLDQINARLPEGQRPYWLLQKRRQQWQHRGEGVAILGNLPQVYHDHLSLGYNGRVALRVNVELPSRQTLDFVATQLHQVPFDQQARQEQAMLLLGWLRTTSPIRYQVVAGDFSEEPTGTAVHYLKQFFRSLYEVGHGREPLATYPTGLSANPVDQGRCVDYMFASPAINQIKRVAIFCDKAAADDPTLYPSEHVGLIATLEL